MLEVSELTYAAIITLELPGMSHPATVSLTLSPPDVVETAPGQYKALRDCTLADIEAFAEAMEAQLWQKYRIAQIDELATDESIRLKITLINEGGKALALSRQEVLQHAIQIGAAAEDAPADAVEDEEPPEATRPGEVETMLEDEAPSTADSGRQVGKEVAEPQARPSPEIESPAEDKTEVDQQEAPEPEPEPAPAPLPTTPAELRIAGLRRPQGHGTPAAADILINEPAMRDAQAHALSSLDREVAGMLIGPRPEKQPDGRYVVHITDIIIARHTRMMGASVTYTPESWRYVTDRLRENYPNEEAVIVGWYHTHPGFGIFLSGMDLFIHQNFFTQKWHVALVLDPRACRMGFFCWDRKQSEVQPYQFPWPDWAPAAW